MLLSTFLATIPVDLQKTVLALAAACAEIATKIRTAETGRAGSQNEFGEEQLALDVLADEILFAQLRACGAVATASSEEQARAVPLAPAGAYTVAFDPLDGSSLVDVNLAVGTIFGVWPGAALLGQTGRGLAAAGYAVYGPRTLLVLALGGNPPAEFTLQPSGEWLCTQKELRITTKKMFAPGNLRAAADNAGYRTLVDFWQQNGYTLRYSGGLVPDFHQILKKGGGIFAYPGSPAAPAKLRLAYECAPLAAVAAAAGGASSDGRISILDLPIESYDQRVPVALGEVAEVERFAAACA